MTQAQGRSIHLDFNIRLTPPAEEVVGSTDAALEIGQKLIQETLLILRHKGETAGFVVDVDAKQVVI